MPRVVITKTPKLLEPLPQQRMIFLCKLDAEVKERR